MPSPPNQEIVARISRPLDLRFPTCETLPRFRAPSMLYEDNPVSIKYYVKRYIMEHRSEFAGKIAIDVPAGSGTTAKAMQAAGAQVQAFDLLPEYITTKGRTCERATNVEAWAVAYEAAEPLSVHERSEPVRARTSR